MSNQKQNPPQQKINMSLPEAVADGIYSNFVIISHSQAEFVLDFARITPGVQKTKVQSRIIMAPSHAYRLMKTLEENIKRFENTHGKLIVDNDKQREIGFSI